MELQDENPPPLKRSWLTLTEAAAELGITSAALRDAVKRGVLRVERVNDRLNVVSRREFERYKRDHWQHKGWDKRKVQPDDPTSTESAGSDGQQQEGA